MDVYGTLDTLSFRGDSRLPDPPPGLAENKMERFTGVLNRQAAEVDRFLNGDFDVTLGMLERRLDTKEHASSRVRKAISAALRGKAPAAIHESLLRLANRGNANTLATTNFDLLFEEVKLPSAWACKATRWSDPEAERAAGVWGGSAYPWPA